MCFDRKPEFCVAKEGYPVPPAFFSLDDSHMTGVALLDPPVYPLVGLDRPLPMLRPGLAQPPPGTGDGLRDKDIGKLGVPRNRRRRD